MHDEPTDSNTGTRTDSANDDTWTDPRLTMSDVGSGTSYSAKLRRYKSIRDGEMTFPDTGDGEMERLNPFDITNHSTPYRTSGADQQGERNATVERDTNRDDSE